jgi:hypothetical protein
MNPRPVFLESAAVPVLRPLVPSRRSLWRGLALLGLVLVGQYWFLTAGTWSPDIKDVPRQFTSDYYSMLADAFAHGQLNLLETPSPELASLPDPYDPLQRAYVPFLWDAAYYHGHYFLVWGPVPGLFLLGWRVLTGLSPVHDSTLVLAFAAGLTTAYAGLLWYLRGWLFAAQPGWAAVAFLALGWGGPLLFVLARPAVYEADILGGQCFLFWGLLFAFVGLNRIQGGWLLAAGLCWGLAVGSRYALMPAVAFLAIAFGFRLYTRRADLLPQWAILRAGLLALPLVIIVALLSWYNFARFGDWIETGMSYCLAGFAQRALITTHGLFTASSFFPNLLDYALRPPKLLNQFPFIGLYASMPPWWPKDPLEAHYDTVVGGLWVTPFVFLSVGTIAVAWKQRRPGDGLPRWIYSWPAQPDWAWINLVLIVAAGLALLPVLFYSLTVTMRYTMDVVPLFVLSAAVAGAGMQVSWPRHARRLRLLGASLGLLTVVLGIALGFGGYFQHFERHNPDLSGLLRGDVSLACYLTTAHEAPVDARLTTDLVGGCPHRVLPRLIDPLNKATQPATNDYVLLAFNGSLTYAPVHIPIGQLRVTLYGYGSLGGGLAPKIQLVLQPASGSLIIKPRTIQLIANRVVGRTVQFDHLPAGNYSLIVMFSDDFSEPGQGDRDVFLYDARFQWVK